MFTLIDCNSFYCSCERVFDPALKNRPVVVLSNNDGCIISLTPEAKLLGIKMGDVYFQVLEQLQKLNIAVFSSNYTLYGDMSRRVMSIIHDHCSDVEVYSIDEAFIRSYLGKGHTSDDLSQNMRELKNRIMQWTGIPTSVGIAPTKVLAKLANRLAKKSEKAKGFLLLNDPKHIEIALKMTPIEEVWGIGAKSAAKLRAIEIHSAHDFAHYSHDKVIQKLLTIVGRRIQLELQGISCLELDEVHSKKSIACTRSFGKGITECRDLEEAISSYLSRALQKLRIQGSLCRRLTFFMRSDRFNDTSLTYDQYSISLESPSNNTLELIKIVRPFVQNLFKKGVIYKKAGVILEDLCDEKFYQLSLFSPRNDQDKRKLMQTIDQINDRYGKSTIFSAACGINQNWKMKSSMCSPRYTTRWSEILSIKS